jgi:thiosulfate/3-mercaptopyruvate sulfurtransferase
MKNTIRTAVLSLALAMASASAGIAQTAVSVAADWSPFMTAETVNVQAGLNSDVQFVDIRSQKYVRKGVVPGAVWLPFSQWRGPSDRPGQMQTEDEIATFIGDAGLRLDQPIVVYNHSGKTVQSGRAAIVYWMLKTAGAEDIAIMNGGFKAWRAAGLPEAEEPFVAQPIITNVSYSRDWWADPLDIFAVTTGQHDGAILDARLDGQVRKSMETGKPIMSMPMAQYMPASFFMRHLSADSLTTPAKSEFRAELEARGIDLGTGMLISVCQTGELSALSWFYASEIVGIDNVRYYPDALRGWEGDGGLMFGLRASLEN